MILIFLAAQAAAPGPYRPAPATIVAEPVALIYAGFDRDGDGRTTKTECRAGIDGFAKANPAWNGQLGYLAYADWAERYLGDRNGLPSPFEIDRNGDGKITLEELGNRIEAIFDRFDKDKDGVLTRAELLTLRTGPTGDRPNRRRDDRDRAEPPPQR